MNERIRELADQAGPLQDVLSEIAEQTNDKPVRYIRNKALLDFQLEKFAELIVKECAAVSRKSSKRIDDMGSLIAQDIEKHFGVEE